MQTSRIICALALLCCAATACSSPTSLVDEQALSQAEAKWATRKLESYTYETVVGCGECPSVVTRLTRVEVRDGAVAAATIVATDSALSTTTAYSTVEGLFVRIRGYQRDDGLREVQVDYDQEFGYPTSILVYAKAGIADGSYGIYNSGLRPTR
jgi:hypothetical protein